MGSLVIKQVEYSGDNYYFTSPEFSTGINVIKGDNGSGKTTLSFFIEFGLGGDIKVFKKGNKEEYTHITEDKNNFVKLLVSIDNKPFSFKRFIGKNDIFIEFPNGEVRKFCIRRQDCNDIFSDWLLSQLDIKRFELSLGATDWFFNFNDLFRLLYYDQDTELRKIYKKPNSDNFVTDSAVIRKSIFETLMGSSSDEYFLKMNELNEAKLKKKEAEVLLEEFNKINSNLKLTLKGIQVETDSLKEQLYKLIDSRKEYQQEHTQVNQKFQQLEDKKSRLIELQILDSQTHIEKKNIQIQSNKIERLLEREKSEIESIEKTIFTQEKLNLFDFKICPFCASTDIIREDKKCICGSTIQENNYEKFVYDSSEYKEILKHKNKSLETIESALITYRDEIIEIDIELNNIKKEIDGLNQFLKEAIKSIEYSGNTQFTDYIDNKMTDVKDEIFELEKLEKLYVQKEKYEKNLNSKSIDYQKKHDTFKSLSFKYKESHELIMIKFNTIYSELMKNSSAKTKKAYINDEYMPLIDDGVYREKSATVPIRMMYFFTLLSMSLKYSSIKYPKFLLMDTPEDAGIDNISENISLFEKALELSRNYDNEEVKDYQFILTTGLCNECCPLEYEKYVKLDFNKKEGRFILEKRKYML